MDLGQAMPAVGVDEIVTLYHARREPELGFDEVKAHTRERAETLRSRAPKRVPQELWGLAIGHNLVRLEMERVARRAGIPPQRISYRHALMPIRNFRVTDRGGEDGAGPGSEGPGPASTVRLLRDQPN